jgi:hypothetical protein
MLRAPHRRFHHHFDSEEVGPWSLQSPKKGNFWLKSSKKDAFWSKRGQTLHGPRGRIGRLAQFVNAA